MPPRRVIGIDAGGTKLLGGVVDEGLVVHHRVHRLWRGGDRAETLDIFVESVEEVRAAAPDVMAVGFGIPALVEWETGVSRWSTHLPLADVQFRDVMSERLGLPVVVDNDANVALLAEARFGAARGVSHAVLVALGTGIGSGLLLDGRIYRGSRGIESLRTAPSSEWTTMIVSARDGPLALSSIDAPVRASEPSTRMFVPPSMLPPLERAFSASADTPSWICALTRNSTSESSSQPPTASASHLKTRPGVIGLRSRGSSGSLPVTRLSRRRRASRSLPRESGRLRAR